MKLRVCLLAVLFGSCLIRMQALDIVSEKADRALYAIYDLRTSTAQYIIDEERKRDPGNLYYEYLENWKQVIELLVYTDDMRYKSYLESLDERLKRIKEEGDVACPSYYIVLGEIYAHAAMANVMYGDYMAAFRKLLKAKRNADKNVEEHPGYWLNDKLVGIMHVSFDKIPSILRWLTALFGLRGDADVGFRLMNRYLSHVQEYPGLKSEIVIYYAFGLRLSRDEDIAYGLFEREMATYQPPVLNLYLQASFMYMMGKNEEALGLMFSFPTERMEVPFNFVDFLRGKLKLNRLDEDADVYLLAFLEHSKFKNYKREVSMKLAYHYYIQGDKRKYIFYKNLTDTYPAATTNRDREADIERERPYEPHLEILKARHLVAGEYFSDANDILSSVDTNGLDQEAYLVEYYLLRAKIYSKLLQDEEATALYEETIRRGWDRSEHYASEAALYAGTYAQSKGDLLKANDYWELALKIKGAKDVYIEYIHDKAKSLIKRNGYE